MSDEEKNIRVGERGSKKRRSEFQVTSIEFSKSIPSLLMSCVCTAGLDRKEGVVSREGSGESCREVTSVLFTRRDRSKVG